ncbi:MAG: tryptophan--tRNA ligase [Clostridiales bacterium]|nr:tryptophan--tRNA ligase [Clostridiales bacterium]
MPENKQVIFSGIQPSGVLTIGNYIGALRNFTTFQETYDAIYCIVDLHAITVRQDPAALRRRCFELMAIYIACGLDPEKCLLFCQSHVSSHAELAWILDCFTYMGELSRMTQFKDKSAKNESNLNAGLFTYPVLMVADILLYQANLVPIGEDQKQHLELTRDVAQRFNNLFSETFTVPEGYFGEVGTRIRSLQEPTRKMSKSDPEDAFVSLLDPPDLIRKKIRRSVTDSDSVIAYDMEKKPGVSNLIEIHSALTNTPVSSLLAQLEGEGYGKLKDIVADSIIATLSPIQAEYHKLIKDKTYLQGIMKSHSEKAYARSLKTLRKVQRKVGLAAR